MPDRYGKQEAPAHRLQSRSPNFDLTNQGFVKVGVAVRDLWGGLTRSAGGVPGVPGQP